MALISQLHEYGNQLKVLYDDGTFNFAYPGSNSGFWNIDLGIGTIQDIGNNKKILIGGGTTTRMAYPTTGSIWLVSHPDGGGGPIDPGGGGNPGIGAKVIYPTAVHSVSDSFQDHVNRGSVNPGTDYTDAVGDQVVSVAAGTVTDGNNNDISGSGGRVMHIDHDDGSGADYLHLSSIDVGVGTHVNQGAPIAHSGASGYGSENYYGAHLHISYRNMHGHIYNGYTGSTLVNIDFDALIRSLS